MKSNAVSAIIAYVTALFFSVGNTTAAPADNDTARQFFADETQSLMVGEQSVAVFPSPSAIPLKRGVAVLLYESGSMGLTFDVAAQISERLNDQGWDTLLVPAMFTPVTATPALPSEDTLIHPRADSQTPVIGYSDSRNTFTLLLNAVFQHTADKDGFRMVIAQGMGAALLLDITNSENVSPPDTAIVLSPFWPERVHNQAVVDNIAQSAYPVLDVGMDDYNNWALSTRHRRSQKARTELKMLYRQQVMLALGSSSIAGSTSFGGRQIGTTVPATASPSTASAVSPFATRLAGRIYGWTTHLGW
ncbi:DUF3530 family protein [Alteromonas halophila]|uniref:DUF3530 family protein n=1 Tax=Alteromonas halophila TaxID=516698 RepID=A0A918JGM9_9ALTE|nr:DUF3530 family protein [Alteromonas halophila]GGW80080.1 hypothetical protein GCM10007391_11150 [Alteromonas halophila]